MILSGGLVMLWTLLVLSGPAGAVLAAGWVLVGGWMVGRTRSRGLAADMIFVVTWPAHLVRHWLGLE